MVNTSELVELNLKYYYCSSCVNVKMIFGKVQVVENDKNYPCPFKLFC